MWAARQLVTITFNPMEAYLIVFFLYYFICLIVELIAHRVEKKLSTDIKLSRTVKTNPQEV